MGDEDKKYLDDQCHKIDFMSIVQSIGSQIKVSTSGTCSERKTVHPHQLQNVQFQNISILPQRRDWSFLGDEGFRWAKKCLKLNWNFQQGGGGGDVEKFPSVGEVWIFSGTTQCMSNYCLCEQNN